MFRSGVCVLDKADRRAEVLANTRGETITVPKKLQRRRRREQMSATHHFLNAAVRRATPTEEASSCFNSGCLGDICKTPRNNIRSMEQRQAGTPRFLLCAVCCSRNGIRRGGSCCQRRTTRDIKTLRYHGSMMSLQQLCKRSKHQMTKVERGAPFNMGRFVPLHSFRLHSEPMHRLPLYNSLRRHI